MLEIGAFPFLVKKEKLYVMLITNTSGDLWILPKGQPEPDLKQPQVAVLESYEEAGVIGKVCDTNIYKKFKRDKDVTLLIYPQLIKKILNKWPEKNFRKRQLVTIKKAKKLVSRQEHLDAIRHFSKPEVMKQFI